MEHWIWTLDSTKKLSKYLVFSIRPQSETEKDIRRLREVYGIKLNDGWNGGFGGADNTVTSRKRKG